MENLKILNEKENLLFKRKEIHATIVSKITPSYTDISKSISEKLSIPEENIKIKNIRGKFGSNEFNINVNVYASKQDKDATEIKTKKELEEEKKATEAAAKEAAAKEAEAKEAEAKQAEAQKEEVKVEEPTSPKGVPQEVASPSEEGKEEPKVEEAKPVEEPKPEEKKE